MCDFMYQYTGCIKKNDARYDTVWLINFVAEPCMINYNYDTTYESNNFHITISSELEKKLEFREVFQVPIEFRFPMLRSYKTLFVCSFEPQHFRTAYNWIF